MRCVHRHHRPDPKDPLRCLDCQDFLASRRRTETSGPDLAEELEELGFSALGGHPGVRRRSTQMDHDPYTHGHDARLAGQPETANPYDPEESPDEYSSWYDGWSREDTSDQEDNDGE